MTQQWATEWGDWEEGREEKGTGGEEERRIMGRQVAAAAAFVHMRIPGRCRSQLGTTVNLRYIPSKLSFSSEKENSVVQTLRLPNLHFFLQLTYIRG